LRRAERQFVMLFVIRMIDAFLDDELWRLDVWLDDMRQMRLDVDFDALIKLACDNVLPIVSEVLGSDVAGRLGWQVVASLQRGEIASVALTQDAKAAAEALLDQRFDDKAFKQRCIDVSQTAVAIARRMFIGAFHLQRIEIAGLIYDLGKSCLDPDVLRSDRPLTHAQWVHLQEHVLHGERLVATHPTFAALDLHEVARWHHERFDGFGYPDGLQGPAIPLTARIVAVADAYHAMLSNRPHADAVPPAVAIAKLSAGAGKQWDPLVTGALLEVLSAERGAVVPLRREAV
jgi:HD-GYP domain-containing protein (c-di-GMP phosphodiesterase class II)